MNKDLLEIFNNVKDWLKFAEAKNAMLIAFNGASIFGIIRFLQIQNLNEVNFIEIYLTMVIILLIFSSVISLISFVPNIKIFNKGLFSNKTTDNILFFEYLKCKSELEIITVVTGEKDEHKISKINIDLAGQIKQISIVASKKYSHFTISLWLTVAAYITIPVAGIYCIYTYIK